MATTAELRDSESAQWELAFLIDGIQRAFVSHMDLEVLDSEDGREYVRGLSRKGLVRRMGVDSRNGHLIPFQHTFDIQDHRGDLAELFATDDESVEPLEQWITPGQDLSGLPQFDNKYIGHEKIGPNGERHQYPVPLGFGIGLLHATLHEDADDSEDPITPPPVSDVPVLWKGRRCMLYRVYRDHIGNSSLDAGLRFRPSLETLEDGPSGIVGTRDAADGAGYRGGPWRHIDFDGVDDRIDWGAGTMPNLVGQPFTISFWVYRRTQATDDRAINLDLDIAGAAALFVDLRTNGAVRILWGTSGTSMERQSAASVVPLDAWTHVLVKGDGSLTAGNYEIYINGVEVASYATTTNGTGVARATAYRWSLGGRFSADTNCVDGKLAFPSVWLRELSGSEALEVKRTVGGFRPFDEWEPIWWGTLEDDGMVKGRVWSIRCAGVDSWLRRDLATLYQTKETPVEFEIDYVTRAENAEAHEGGIYIVIRTTNEGGAGGAGGALSGRYGTLDFPLSPEFTADNVVDLRQELSEAINTAYTLAGDHGAWSEVPGGASLNMQGRDIVFSMGEDVAQQARCYIGMHKKIWGHLGFDIGILQDDGSYSREGFFAIEAVANLAEPPGDGYVVYKFVLGSEILHDEFSSHAAAAQTLQPDYKGGVVSLDPEAIKDGQVMLVGGFGGLGGETIAHYGQLLSPVASDPNDPDEPWPIGGTGADTWGLWLLSGPRRFADTDEELETFQVVETSWRTVQGLVGSGRVVITGLLNPKRFGYDNTRITTAWNAQPGQIVARPLVCLGYHQGSELDEAHVVMQRLLLTTGTSTGWDSFSNDSPVLDAGTNENSHGGNIRRDAELADLGLAIPSSMVQHASTWSDLAEEVGEAVKVKVAITPGQNSEDVLHGLMEPLGWAWSLRNGKYGQWCPFHSITEEQIEVAITRSQVDRKTGKEIVVPAQAIRQFAPIDRFRVKASWAPHSEEYLFERTAKAADRGVRYRPGGITEEIAAPWWRGKDGGGVTEPIFERLKLKAKFWERRHFVVERLPILPTEGRRLWPATFIRFSHPMPVDPIDGTYGVTGRRGAVLYLEENLDPDRGGFLADFLIHADRTSTPKLHAFSARGYGYDTDNDRILVHDNWLALQGDGTRMDSAFAVEPEYVGLEPFGGDADIKWYQWDGSGWEQTGSGTVTAVGTTPGSCYLEMSAGISSGTYYACKDTIVVFGDATVQNAEWVLQLYTGIGDETGEVDTGVLASRWEDVA